VVSPGAPQVDGEGMTGGGTRHGRDQGPHELHLQAGASWRSKTRKGTATTARKALGTARPGSGGYAGTAESPEVSHRRGSFQPSSCRCRGAREAAVRAGRGARSDAGRSSRAYRYAMDCTSTRRTPHVHVVVRAGARPNGRRLNRPQGRPSPVARGDLQPRCAGYGNRRRLLQGRRCAAVMRRPRISCGERAARSEGRLRREAGPPLKGKSLLKFRRDEAFEKLVWTGPRPGGVRRIPRIASLGWGR